MPRTLPTAVFALLASAPVSLAQITPAPITPAQTTPASTTPTATGPAQSSSVQSTGAPAAPAQSLDLAAPAASTSHSIAPQSYARRAALTCSDFQRRPDASWDALQSVTLPAPDGPLMIDAGTVVRPGQMLGGYDLGSMLERSCSVG